MIKVTLPKRSITVYLNPFHVVSVYKGENDETRVRVRDDGPSVFTVVNESVESIVAAVTSAVSPTISIINGEDIH